MSTTMHQHHTYTNDEGKGKLMGGKNRSEVFLRFDPGPVPLETVKAKIDSDDGVEITDTRQSTPLRTFELQVVVRPGQTRFLSVTAATTGGALWRLVHTDTGLPDFYLLHAGHKIEEAETLGALGVGASSSIEVKLRGRGGAADDKLLHGLSLSVRSRRTLPVVRS